MRITFNPSTVAALTSPPNNKDITFDLRGQNIFARGVKFYGTDTNTWRDIKINNVSIGSHTLDLRNGSNTTLTNTNGVVTINSTWRPVVDNLTSDSTTSSLSANQGRVLAGLINGKSDSDHNHDGRYIRKSGDTMLGALNFANGTWNLVGDDSYMGDCNISGHFGIKAANTTYPGIAFFNNASAFLGNLTAYSGNIKYGAYSLQFLDNGNTSVSSSTWTNPFSAYNSNAVADGQAICVWGQASQLSNLSTDTGDMSLWLKRVNAKCATLNMVLDGEYYANGNQRLAHVSEIPTSLKNPYALTISLNGTSQGPYDGSAAKNINITPSSIGAATSDHNHDGRYVYNYGGTQMDGASVDKNALGMTTNSGVTGDWWHILQAAWNGEYRWNSQIAFPTQNRNGMYYRSGLNDNTAWGSWVKLLDTNNYSGILDSRYYTESEVNSLLDAKLNRQNLSYGTWNPRGYNLAADYFYNGGDLSISELGGQIHVSVDGYFWQNEGQYRVLDTSDVAGLKGDLTVHQYLSNTDTTWWPLIWGGSSHDNTSDSTGAVYKSHDVLSWQTSSQTLYATHLRTTFIDLENNRGTNTNAWSIHRKSDNNFAISRNSSDGVNGLVMTSTGMGLGTTTPTQRLDVNGNIRTTGNLYISHAADNNMNYNTSNPRIVFSESGNQAVGLVYTDYDSYRASKGLKVMDVDNSDPGNVWFEVQGYNYSSGYVKNGSNDNYILLGGGGHKAISDFAYGSNYVKAFGTSNANIDADWGQSFKTFDPIPSGTPPEQNPNISLLSIGENFDRRKQLAFIYNNDNIYYRRRIGGEGFSNWKRLAFADEIPTSLPANGGNADTVDGEHASNFVRAGAYGSSNLNSLDTYSFIKSVESTVASASPNGNTGWYNVIQAVHRNGAFDGPNYIGQIALGMTTNLSAMFYRIKYGGSWYAWNEVVTTNTGLLRYSRNNVNISSPNCSPIPPSLLEWTVGYPRLYDPEFNKGDNNVQVYNNEGNGVVTVTRVRGTNVGNSSSYIMKVVSAAGASPNYGGWCVPTQTELGKVYTCLFRASIPSGVEIGWNSNSIGSGGQMSWLTNNMGTGKWTWYAVQVYCGSGGSDTFYFSAKSPCTWYLSYVNVIENNRASYAGLRSVYSDYLKQNASLVFGRNELQYFNQYTGVTSGATNNANPKTDWYHILRMNHANNSGYFVDLAIPFFNNRIQFRRITNGSDNGWRRVITEEPNHNVILREASTDGNVGIGINNPAYKLDVNGQMRADGFHHWTVNSDNYILLAGGGYKSFGGDDSNPIFLGYLNLYHGDDGTISGSFSCLGYSVPFTYTRGGNYCRIYIPDTIHQVFYIGAATASVHYSGGGMDTWTGVHRGSGAWWLHCYASGTNEVRVKGFHQSNGNNDSWWGGNPLWSNNEGANKITVCIFGYVEFR